MPKVTCSTLENPEGVLAERESSSPMEISRGDLYTQRSECKYHRAVSYNLAALRRRENLLQDSVPTANGVPLEKRVHRHLSAEGESPRSTWMLRTHRSGEPVDPGGKEDQRRPCRTLDGSYQCLRVHSPQAGQRNTDKTSCTRDDPQHHSGLLQQVQIESFIRNGNICQATATKKTSLPAAQSQYHSSL